MGMPNLRKPRDAALVTLREHHRVTGAEPSACDCDSWADHYAKTAGAMRRIACKKRDAETVKRTLREGKAG